jgi:hypothetical protein
MARILGILKNHLHKSHFLWQAIINCICSISIIFKNSEFYWNFPLFLSKHIIYGSNILQYFWKSATNKLLNCSR